MSHNKKGYNEKEAQSKVNTVMSEFKDKKLHSGARNSFSLCG